MLTYQQARGHTLRGMGVVIQKEIEAVLSGVLFTESPLEPGYMLIEYCDGPGELLVSGQVNPGRARVSRTTGAFEVLSDGELAQPLSAEHALLLEDELSKAAMSLEEVAGVPQDIEWVVDEQGQLFLVQARPITVPAPSARGVERDTTDRPKVMWSNANINENYPDPVTPLLHSIAVEAYENYFRGLGEALGISEERIDMMQRPLQNLVGTHGGRLYYNLTNIHACLSAAPFSDLLTGYWNAFVGVEEDPRAGDLVTVDAHGIVSKPQTPREIIDVVTSLLRFSRELPSRIERFEGRVDAFAEGCGREKVSQASLADLLISFREFLDIRFRYWTDAALGDAASTFSYGALRALLRSADGLDDSDELARRLLEGGPPVASGQPVDALWELSREARSDQALRELFRHESTETVLNTIRSSDSFNSFEKSMDTYLESWGFRVSGELLLTVPSLQEQPESFIEIFRGYLEVDDADAPQARERKLERYEQAWQEAREALLAGAGPINFLGRAKVALLGPAVRWMHQSIGLRERARLKQSLLYNRFRRVVLALADYFVEEGLLKERDDVFFLTYPEIDALAAGNAMTPAVVRQLVEVRRAGLEEVSKLTPPDTVVLPEGVYFEGSSTPLKPKAGSTVDKDELMGMGACGGTVRGRAKVLRDLSEAGGFVRGDLLVAKQTDPGWGPLFLLAGGLVMERGGLLSHGAIVAREFGIPAVVGVLDAQAKIPNDAIIDIDGDEGTVRVLDAEGEDGSKDTKSVAV